jgi:site-specific DNA-methyltransferase (adenine-specific)
MEEFDKAGHLKSAKIKSTNNKEYEGGSVNIVPNQTTDYRDDNTYADEGHPARFFYCSKASKSEKEAGLDIKKEPEYKERAGLAGEKKPTLSKNTHPTIKPVKLMSYLINMITPPEGIVLDPFMGSGSTGVASVLNGYSFIGIEKEPPYMEISKSRIEYHMEQIKNKKQ